jgi:hypothetical protein
MKLSRNERILLGFVWAVALGTIAFTYINATKKQKRDVITECSVYIPTTGTITLVDCTKKLTDDENR